jgi:hypothetical protein
MRSVLSVSSPDPDEEATNTFDPLVPRPIDQPTQLAPNGELESAVGDIAKIFAAPDDPTEWQAWREALAAWRASARERLDYRGAAYDDPYAEWASRAYSVAQVWLWDERLYNAREHRFTVDRFIGHTREHGGYDGVVLWHAYPVIGIDDRNQFDFYRDVPGIRDLVEEFHARGIRVFIDYNPWDTGTRRAERADPEELAALVGELGVDGVFLDTMKEGDDALVDALRSATPPQVLEGESRVPNPRIEDHLLSWAQWFADSEAPGVMRAHWYERRHMMHSTRRWNRDHSDELQSAWMNGTGILVWDAVFGVWVGWNPRDASTLRRMVRAQRALTEVLVYGTWTPLADTSADAVAARVYSSRFARGEVALWTLVNRSDDDYTGRAIEPWRDADLGATDAERVRPAGEDLLWFDVTSGREIVDGTVTVPARSIAGVVAVPGATSPELIDRFRALTADAAADPHTRHSEFPVREARRVIPPQSRTASSTTEDAEAIRVPAGTSSLRLTYRRRETGLYQGAPYVEEWKPLPPRLHDHRGENLEVIIGDGAVARREVTIAEYRAFVEQAGYRPAVPNRFLVGLPSEGNSDPRADARPVTGVNLDDARAYAAWAGARLPTEFEWQLAASDPRFERLQPLVWNWTESEHTDGISRFVMLKGGADYAAAGSDWYTDGGPRDASFSLKFLLPGLGVDRSSSIGFRLAWDGAGERTLDDPAETRDHPTDGGTE